MESKNILDHYSDIDDPRKDNKRHLLIDIIAIVICASICSAESWEDISIFGQAKESWLRKFLELPHGIPSKDTFRRVFAALDPDEFNRCFRDWVALINPNIKGEFINIDGKTLRRSHDSKLGKSAIHMVSAWANKAGLTLGQVKTDEKSNEITAIPQLLEMLHIKGCVVTIDAMGTQKVIAKKIIEKEADYVLALKGNQGTLHEDIKFHFSETSEEELSKPPFSYYKTFEKDHGRIEQREYWVTDDIDWLSMKKDWDKFQSICMMKSKRTVKDYTTTETWFFISSLPADGKTIGDAIRSHWGIENSLHWSLDMAFREDESRKRIEQSAENYAILRHITLNLLKQEKSCKRSIAGKRLLAGWDANYLEKVLFQAK
jgi:predicted transposase YbfD/YdcC